jgi:hypothetical protein
LKSTTKVGAPAALIAAAVLAACGGGATTTVTTTVGDHPPLPAWSYAQFWLQLMQHPARISRVAVGAERLVVVEANGDAYQIFLSPAKRNKVVGALNAADIPTTAP